MDYKNAVRVASDWTRRYQDREWWAGCLLQEHDRNWTVIVVVKQSSSVVEEALEILDTIVNSRDVSVTHYFDPDTNEPIPYHINPKSTITSNPPPKVPFVVMLDGTEKEGYPQCPLTQVTHQSRNGISAKQKRCRADPVVECRGLGVHNCVLIQNDVLLKYGRWVKLTENSESWVLETPTREEE